ncbi:acetyl-CoA carboxylase biotin carboxyl carrier protein [Belliella kenyensis]|uniref:Biotin carboxyl carrier protein of acetyl-CoA carboxylase n=1 Tax=Belliella kenyensis TaxID=1472724 RepID=A0ABV8EPW4_9BACT|nr:acetyl-CoA carboxylase biotin carboxyl carrier protein [Belliella kenyensis]MCH7402074.1 acetyl-CoA carboxylase biotin carboxyl carrier protein [Belliella kenyensis]MDN3601515.1 acetyl-CoA carboxylase biotin carboxyl carrier protein [Belliella kenyensis]MDN3605238.1 acetyl-CoA carboxylase biotin carboxyl carrier protein [Belliella kenyensis]
MKAKEIQDLIDFISNSGLAEVKIETEEFKLSIKKNSEAQYVAAPAPVAVAAPAPAPAPAASTPAAPAAPAKEDTSKYIEIKSPMIGTFYKTPNPDSPAFVNVGDTISSGQTVCIIEAMKLFNEIESEVSGKIVKILVENATPVEYDQPLFLVDPAG